MAKTKTTVKSTAGTTAVPMDLSLSESELGGLTADVADMPASMPDASPSAGAAAPGAAAMRERIHGAAARVHQAIDKLEQTLSGAGGSVTATQAKYGEQARQYGDKLRQQVSARPLQSAGIALGVGLVLTRMFRPAPKVRVVHVPVYRPVYRPAPASRAISSVERPVTRWTQTVAASLQRLRAAGQEAAGKAGMAASLGVASIKATSPVLMNKAATLPLQMRLASSRLLARSQQYGSLARSTAQANPKVAIGTALGLGALASTAVLQRRRASTGTAYATSDSMDTSSGARGVIASRPVTSAAVALGLLALAGVMLKRR